MAPSPPLRRRRFAYGYALDGSECPSYLVWPQRDTCPAMQGKKMVWPQKDGQSYILLDTSTTDTLVLDPVTISIGANLELHTSVCPCLLPLLEDIRRSLLLVHPRRIFSTIAILLLLQLLEDYWGPVGRKPHLQGIRVAETTNPVTKAGAFFFCRCRARSKL